MGYTNCSDANYLKRTFAAQTVTNLTMMGWFWISSLTGGANGSVIFEVTNDSSIDYDLNLPASSATLNSWNGSATLATGFTLALNRWYHIAMTISTTVTGTTIPYVNGSAGAANATGGNLASATAFYVGRDFALNESLGTGAKVSNIKIWWNAPRVMNVGEIRREMKSYAPVIRQNRFSWWPTDDTGNKVGKDYTWTKANDAAVNGTLNYTADPRFIPKSTRMIIDPWRIRSAAAASNYDRLKNNHQMTGFI